MVFFILIGLGVVLLSPFLIEDYFKGKRKKEEKNNKNNLLTKMNDLDFIFVKKYAYIFNSFPHSIGIDSKHKKIVFCHIENNSNLKFVDYSFSSIVDAKINVDGKTVVSSSTFDTISRSLVGGVLAGGVGAVIGGTTGEKTTGKEVKKIELEIVVNDLEHSSVNVVFFDSPVALTEKWSDQLVEAKKQATEWLNTFKVIQYQSTHSETLKDTD